MGKRKHRDRWRDESGRQREMSYDSRAEMEKGRAKRLLGTAPTEPTGKPVSMTFKELAEMWIENHAKLSKSPGQADQDRRNIGKHLLPVFGDVDITGLNEGHLNAVRVAMQKAGLKPKTIRNVMAMAKVVASYGMESQDGKPALLTVSPFAKVKLGRVGKQPFDYWMPDERDTFVRLCRQVDRPFGDLVCVAAHTGLRRGELAGLRRCDIDLDRKQIRVGRVFNFLVWDSVETTKNGDTEFIPMNQAVYDALKDKRFLKPEALIFDWCLAESVTKLRKYAVQFGVKPIRFHDLRHTFASCLVMAGVPTNTVRTLLRQRSEAMVLRYAHLSPQYLHESVDVLCGVNVGKEKEKDRKLAKEQGESWCHLSDSNREDKIA